MNLTDFQNRIAQTNKPVVIDFWAPWCGPCRMSKPILEKLAKEFTETVELIPINADDSREVLEHFHISGIPTVIALRNGQIAGRITGYQSEAGYRTLFTALAEGVEVKVHLTPFDRYLRLGAGTLLLLVGLFTGSWLAAGLGGLVAFLGVYDRCPIWAQIHKMAKSVRTKTGLVEEHERSTRPTYMD